MSTEDVRRPLESCAAGLEGFAEANREGEESVAAAMGHLTVAMTALSVAQEELVAAGINLEDARIKFGLGNTRARTAVLLTEKVDTSASDNNTIRTLPAFVIPLEKVSRGTMAEISRAKLNTEDHATVVASIFEEVQQVAGEVSSEQAPMIPRMHEAGEWAGKIREYIRGL